MSKRKKLVAILLSIGATCIMIVFLISFYNCTAYTGPGYCAEVEADARSVAAAIADYFAVPEHTDVRPSDLKDLELENPWTFTKCGDEITIIVFDRKRKCPRQGRDDQFEWNSHICILRYRP
ncbi:MAG: hypothetical protein PVH82_12855 [Desulfobacteraceae bacterium]|jgi:hypothetical protein